MPDGCRGRRCAEAGRRGAGTGRCRRRDPGDRTDPEFRSSSRTGRSPSSSWITSLHSHPSELQRRARRKVVTRTTAPEYNAPHHRGAPPPRAARQPETNMQPFTGRRATIAGDDDSARPPTDPRPAPSTVLPAVRPGQGQAPVAGSEPARQPPADPARQRPADRLPARHGRRDRGPRRRRPVRRRGRARQGRRRHRLHPRRFRDERHLDPVATRLGPHTGRPALARAARRAVHQRGHRRPRGHRPVRARGRQEPSPAGVPDAPRPAPHGRSRTSPSPTGRRRSSRSS